MDTTKSTATTALEHRRPEPAPLTYDETLRKIIIATYMRGATEQEAAALITVAERRRLDVFKGQIHFVKRKQYNDETGQYEERWAFQVAIDGFRSRAEETAEHEGQDEPVFTFEPVINPANGEDTGRKQLVARVTVHRKGRKPATGVARWLEFVQTKRDGSPTKMWRDKPHHMLAKCAEADALRRAYPEQLGGLYTDDEMGREEDGDGRTVAPGVTPLSNAAPPPAQQKAAPKPESSRPGFTGDDARDISTHVEAMKRADTTDALKRASDEARRRWPQERPAAVRAAYQEVKTRITPSAPPAEAPKTASCDGNHAEPPCGAPGCWLAPPPSPPVAESTGDRQPGEDDE